MKMHLCHQCSTTSLSRLRQATGGKSQLCCTIFWQATNSSQASRSVQAAYAEWNEAMKREMNYWRGRQGWEEPFVFPKAQLSTVMARSRVTWLDTQKNDHIARAKINSHIFNGELHWVNAQDALNLEDKRKENSPFGPNRVHRQLPVQVDPSMGHKQTPIKHTYHGRTPEALRHSSGRGSQRGR